MKRLLLFIYLLTTTSLFSQAPVNDICSGAISLGILGDPGACGSGTVTGTVKTLATTNINSTPENPYTTLAGCNSGTMAAPANDVWYSFVAPASGFGVNIQITGGGAAMSTPNIALWSGSCGNLAGVACIVGSGGSATLSVPSGMLPGQTYYIQISGGTGQSGTFTLKINAYQDCSDCMDAAHITVSPTPVNGSYQPGQVVSFCFHVDQWTNSNQNWLHGVQMSFGNGWDLTTLTTSPPAVSTTGCTGSTSWSYYAAGGDVSSASHVSYPAGFYFDGNCGNSALGSSGDGKPGNNIGDPLTNGNTGVVLTPSANEWKFCWTIQVASGCNPGASLSVTVTTTGDGESGSWTSTGCSHDPPTNFSAVQACCPPTINVTNVLCNGQSTGSATATAVVGTAGNQDPYVFAWTGGATATNTVTVGTTNNLPNLPAGNYTVTVTDKNLCAASTTVTVTQPTVISAVLTPVNATCLVKGSITTVASGGTAPYTYAWSGPNSYTSTTQSPTALVPGTYSLTITDHNNCTHTTTATVAQTGSITVTATSPTVCANGTATITAGGATTYSWTAGVTTSTGTVVTASSVTATTSYTVTGTTGTCTNTAVSTVSVVANPTLTVTSPTVCTGKTATITATGNATTYSWTAGVAPTTGTIVTVSPGTTTSYTVTGTKSTCTNTVVSTVSVIANPTLTVTSPTVCAGKTATITATGNATTYSWTAGVAPTTGTVVTVNLGATTSYTVTGAVGTCSNTAVSTVSVTANPTLTVTSPTICAGTIATITSAGNATTYSWTAGVTPTTGMLVTVSPGATTSYTVTGTKGTCTNTAVSTVSVTPKPTILVNNASICSGGTATLTASGASSYTWSNSATTSSISVSPVGNTSYTVSGTANSCSNTAIATVSVVSSLTVTINSPTICAGTTALLTADGAATYTWSTGAIANAISVSPVATSSYTVTGSAGTCSATATTTVTIAPNPTVTVSSPTVCANATATLTANGAANYSWTAGATTPTGTVVTVSPGATTTSYTVVGTTGICSDTTISTVTVIPNPTVTVNSPTICATNTVTLTGGGATTYSWSTSETTNSISVSPASTISYTVTGTTNACTDTAVATVSVISNPTITVNNAAICIGQQTATLTANSNATSFAWSPATGLSTTTDALVTATPSSTQTYTIIGSAGSCTVSTTATVTVNILPTISATSSTICLGQQTATLSASGAGTGTYSWDPPTGLSATSGSLVTGMPVSTQNYTVTGTDANGCVNTVTDSITVSPIPTVTVNNPSICANNTVILTAGGASTYSWSTSETTASILVSPTATSSYTVTGTTNSCTNTAVSTVSIISNPTVTVNSAAICISQQVANLTANSNASSFTWSPATGLNASTGNAVTATPVTTQTYTITASAGTCTASTTATVTVNPLPTISATSSTICPGQQTATLTASGAGAGTYNWDPPTGLSATSGSVVTGTPTSTQVYIIIGTDVNGCFNTATDSISASLIPTVMVNNPSICATNTVTLTAAGASTYSWSTNATTNSISVNPFGTTSYTVTGTTNSCTNTAVSTVSIISNPTITVNNAAICIGQQTATLTANSNASSFNWSPATGLSTTTGNIVTATPSSTQTYTITGSAGTCTVSTIVTVTVNTIPVISATSGTICLGQQTTTLTASGAGAGTYNWDPPTGLSVTSGSIVTGTPTSTQVYTITGTDVNGCFNTATNSISVSPIPTVTVNNPSICATNTITLTATGASTYSWNTNSTTSSISVGPPGTTSYTVTGTTNSCTNTAVSMVSVISNPTITVNSAAICKGQQTATLTATSNASSFAWSPATGLSATTGNAVTAIPSSTQTYTITGSAGTCTASTTAIITVNPLPVPIATANTPCETEQSLTLTSLPNGMNSYFWSGPNTYSANTQNITIPLGNVTQALAGMYTILVTDNNSCTNTVTVNVMVHPKPTVTATGATVCVGQTFTLTSGGAGVPPNAGYNWTGNGYNSAVQNPSIVSTASMVSINNTYNVVGTDVNGCYSGVSVQVTVNSLPVITVNSGTMCIGQTTTNLTASSTNMGTNYSWSPSAGLSAATGSSVIANPFTAGNYTYVVTGTDGSSCVGTNTATVLVNSLPNITAISTVICAGQQTATLAAGGGVTYTWSPATGLNATTGNTVTGTPVLTQSYTVTGTDINGCYKAAMSNITVNPIPVLTANSGTICLGQATATLTAASSNAGTLYNWTPSTDLSATTGASVVANPSPANNYTYVVTGIDANNCVGTFSTTVLVNPLPLLNIVATPTAICLTQQTATITASGASTYTWSPPTGLNTTKGSIVKANPVKSQNYTVTATDIHNCVNTTVTGITVNPLPVVTISPVPSECIPFCTPVTATCSPAATGYTWNFNNGQPLSTSTLSPSPILTASTCYSVSGTYPVKLTVTDINVCVNSGTGSVLAFSQPSADFDYGPQPVSILTPEVQFINESSPGLTHYSWNFGDIYKPDTSSLVNPIHNYSDVGTYYVTLTVSTNKGCSASVVKPIIINDDYAIYVPNAFTPNQDGKNEMFIAVGEGISIFKMWIFDRWGLLIFYSDDITKGWDGTIQGKDGNIVQQDVYVWKIALTNIKNKSKELAGTVTLLK
jgi:gliding motility-associated-like protein